MSATANGRQDYRNPRAGVDLAATSDFPDMSARHADHAVSALIASELAPDSREREQHLRLAQVYATLSLRDKVDELTATLKRQWK